MERLWTRPFIVMTLSMFFLFFGFYLLLPTLPVYVRQLGASESQVGLVMGVFTLAAVLARPVVGGLLDRYGRRVFTIAGLLFFALCVFLYNWASGLALMLLLRIVHGFSWAVSTTSIGTAITDVIPAQRRGEGVGWSGLATTVSMAIGPMIGVSVVQHASFPSLFLLATGLSVVALLLAFTARVPFARQEHKGEVRFFDRKLLPVSAVTFFASFTYGGIVTFVPLFAETVRVNAGTFFLLYAIALGVTRPVAGKLADRWGEGVVLVPSILLLASALAVLSQSSGPAGVFASAVLYGVGFGSAQPTLQSAALRLVPPNQKGIATASFFTALDLGIGLGAILLGWVSQHFGYSLLFLVCAGSGLLSLLWFIGFARPVLRKHGGSEGA